VTGKKPKNRPIPGTALAYAASVLEEGGVGYTLNPSMETTVTFVGPKGAAAMTKRKLSEPGSDSDEASRQPGTDR
jgi:hypothetical protein